MADFASIEVAAERTRIIDDLIAIDNEAGDAEQLDAMLSHLIEQLRGADNDGTK